MYHYVSQLCNYREDIFLGAVWGVLVTCPILEHVISRVRGGTANQAVNGKYLGKRGAAVDEAPGWAIQQLL